jgi:hypothetical protein
MYKSLIILALGFAVAGCSCSDDAKKKAAADRGQATAPAQQAQAGKEREAPAEAAPAGPTEAELRVERVVAALRDQGLGPTFDETLPTRLGNLDECRPTERRRYNLDGELVYVIVGTYATAADAETCIKAYEAFLGTMWNQFKNDFYQHDRYVIELNPQMTAPQKKGSSAAVRKAL